MNRKLIQPGESLGHRVSGVAASALGNMLMAVPFLNKINNYKKDSLRIVYYHIVGNQQKEYYFNDKLISPKVFNQHLDFLQKRFDIVSLSDALEMAENNEPLSRKLVLTFDDGFSENYHVIAPLLHARRIPATFFLIGNCIDNKDLMWRNKLLVITKKAGPKLLKLAGEASRIFSIETPLHYKDILEWSFMAWPMSRKEEIVNHLWKVSGIGSVEEYLQHHKPYLTREEIGTMLDAGFEIGSHSLSHPNFSRLIYEEFEEEIVGSVQLLKTYFKKEIIAFSYPFGRKPAVEFEQKLVDGKKTRIKTFLGTKNKLNNYHDSHRWERDNLEFPMNKMLFRLNILPLVRRFA